MKTENEFPSAYKDYSRQHEIPHTLKKDNAKSKNTQAIKNINREYIITDEFAKPHHLQQNLTKLNEIKFVKSHFQILIDKTNSSTIYGF